MSERVWNERELERRANRRLAVLRHAEEVSGNVATILQGMSGSCRHRTAAMVRFLRSGP